MEQLEVRRLSFSYGKHPVLRDVSFSVEQGSLVALLGANGAGKSTLFRCILGFLKPEGEIFLEGRELSAFSRRDLAAQIAYIPQSSEPIFNYTVLDTVLMGTTGALGTLEKPHKAQEEAAWQALAQLGIEKLAQRGVEQISGGERQLVLIARALVQNARILVMDEPTANLDFGNQQRVLREIRRLTRRGYTVLMSTHNPEQALRYATHVLALREGSLYAGGRTKDVLTAELIEALYGVRVHLEELGGRTVMIMEE